MFAPDNPACLGAHIKVYNNAIQRRNAWQDLALALFWVGVVSRRLSLESNSLCTPVSSATVHSLIRHHNKEHTRGLINLLVGSDLFFSILNRNLKTSQKSVFLNF